MITNDIDLRCYRSSRIIGTIATSTRLPKVSIRKLINVLQQYDRITRIRVELGFSLSRIYRAIFTYYIVVVLRRSV